MTIITNFLIINLDFILCIKFEDLFFESTHKKSTKLKFYILALIPLFMACFIEFSPDFLSIFYYDFIYLIFFCFYYNKPNLFKLWITLALEGIVFAIPGAIIYCLLQFLQNNHSITSTTDGISCNNYLMYLFLFILMSTLEYLKNRKNKVVKNPYEHLVSFFIFSSTLFLLYIAESYKSSDLNTIFIVVFIYLFISFILLYYFFKKITEQKQTEYDLKLALDLSKLTHDYEERLEQNTAMLRSLRHDLKNHLIAIEGYIKTEDTGKALDYIHTISSETIFPDTLVNTKSVPLSALLSSKKQLCQEKEILFAPEIITTSSLITDIDLCIIVGNLLDNAIEAAEKVEDQHGYIDFSLQARNNIIHILCCNNYLTQPIISRDKLVTHKVKQKGLHGIGLENVQKLVDKYDGTMKYSFEDHIFNMEILMKVPIPVME